MRLILFLLCFIASCVTARSLPVVVEETVHSDYLTFLAGRDPLTIEDFSGPKSRRSTVELVLLQQAFALSGMPVELTFSFGPNAQRMQQMVRGDDFAMLANTVWLDAALAVHEDLFISEPMVRNGEFEAGLYVIDSRDNLLVDGVDVSALSAVSSDGWVSDWRTLQALDLAALYNVPRWASMLDMVETGRADFLLAPFQSTDDLSFVSRERRYVPLPGIKLGLDGSRHFVISKSFPNGELLSQQLNLGIELLRERDAIVRAYRQAGLFNATVDDWRKLNPVHY